MQANVQSAIDSDQAVGLLSVAKSPDQDVFGDIYNPSIGMTVWQRPLGELSDYAESLLVSSPNFSYTSQGSSEKITTLLGRLLPDADGKEAFVADIGLLVDMFACLFDLEEVGVRLTALSSAMCPRFHVDKIPCRMVSTYSGTGSEWLHEAHVIRDHLGRGGRATDLNSGLSDTGVINRLQAGDVAIMKGDEWPTSLGRGMVHRSPAASAEDKRLFLSIDMI
ncbi:DUF1826 domain-containing protein [Marinomonas sp. A79]|uniref:DUF1826 domain-containing protein n=1 Tax=Marinomonas vulgaris TaxID=2823372 RepID=A0ABS5HBL9_9GAMM|nr:DUF1826 domain-containing protein [Marinomonas vulgaris]MBR7889062.1 DUF1826 domain-containing protein [Marinomonas vulgaris]